MHVHDKYVHVCNYRQLSLEKRACVLMLHHSGKISKDRELKSYI